MNVTMSQNIGELAKALASAQRVMEHAKKTKTNPFHKNKYADLTDVWDVLKKPLSDNGLSVVQLPAAEGPYLILTTILMHTSDQWISSVFRVKAKAETAQEMGSTLTYARRYALAAITGNSSDEDDDGNSASGVYDKPHRPVQEKAQPQVVVPPQTYQATAEQKKTMAALCANFGITDTKALIEISSKLMGMPMLQIEEAIVELSK